jgi:hypothetical protein
MVRNMLILTLILTSAVRTQCVYTCVYSMAIPVSIDHASVLMVSWAKYFFVFFICLPKGGGHNAAGRQAYLVLLHFKVRHPR